MRPLIITFADGQKATVQTNLEDRLKFETSLKHNRGWGTLKDNTLKLIPYLGWAAAQRTGVTHLSWTEFTTGPTAALDVEEMPEPEEGEESEEGEGNALEAPTERVEVEGLGEPTPQGLSTISPSY